MADLGAEAFWGVTFTEEPVNREITVVITGKDVEKGPYVWLNTEAQTSGSSYENGEKLEQNLIYNAVYRMQVHYIRQPLLTTAMLAVLGGMFFCWQAEKLRIQAGQKSGTGKQGILSARKERREDSGISVSGFRAFIRNTGSFWDWDCSC